MAQKHIIRLIDDINGLDADETIAFSLDGTHYEIDLTAENAAKLRDAMAIYVANGRRLARPTGRLRGSGAASGPGGPSGRGSARAGRAQTATIREWARKNGHRVGDKGRIPAQIVEAYEADHGGR